MLMFMYFMHFLQDMDIISKDNENLNPKLD